MHGPPPFHRPAILSPIPVILQQSPGQPLRISFVPSISSSVTNVNGPPSACSQPTTAHEQPAMCGVLCLSLVQLSAARCQVIVFVIVSVCLQLCLLVFTSFCCFRSPGLLFAMSVASVRVSNCHMWRSVSQFSRVLLLKGCACSCLVHP